MEPLLSLIDGKSAFQVDFDETRKSFKTTVPDYAYSAFLARPIRLIFQLDARATDLWGYGSRALGSSNRPILIILV